MCKEVLGSVRDISYELALAMMEKPVPARLLRKECFTIQYNVLFISFNVKTVEISIKQDS